MMNTMKNGLWPLDGVRLAGLAISKDVVPNEEAARMRSSPPTHHACACYARALSDDDPS